MNFYALLVLMRLNRPIGIILLWWPTLWALWIASQGSPSFSLLIIFGSGTLLMRSAGCVINDLTDERFDAHVSRTRNRPLVTGVVSRRQAWALWIILCLLASTLLLWLNPLARGLALIAFFLAMTYPFMKRYTHLPQLVLGLAYSFGIPMAFAAQTNEVPWIAWWLVLINWLWTVAYDTLYAMVDRPDDLKIGVKSTAILLGVWDVPVINLLHVLMLTLLAGLGYEQHYGIGFYSGLLIAGGIMIYLHGLMRTRNPEDCFKAFLNSQWIGAAVFLGLWLGS